MPTIPTALRQNGPITSCIFRPTYRSVCTMLQLFASPECGLALAWKNLRLRFSGCGAYLFPALMRPSPPWSLRNLSGLPPLLSIEASPMGDYQCVPLLWLRQLLGCC